MATTTNITTSYAGQEAAPYVAAALLESVTLNRGGVDVMPGIKFRKTLRPTNIEDIIADSTCDFTATGDVTILERYLEPKELQVNQKFCKKDFTDTWEAQQMGFGLGETLPKAFSDFIIAEYAAQVAEKNEINLWRGDKGNDGEYDGFVTLISADADLPTDQEIAGTTVDASNVIDELGKIVDAIPDRLYGKEDMKIYVANNIYKAYKRALGGFGANGLGANGVNGQGNNQNLDSLQFDGVEIFQTFGLAANTAIATRKSNLKFGVGDLANHGEVKLLDMADVDASRNVRFVMRFSAGVQYEFAKDFVTYGITNSANPA